MNKYYKNMILCSELDYYCLLCQESFEAISDVNKHLRWEKHRHSIKHQNNVPKYKEFIHKIDEIYYCEICNFVCKLESLQQHIKSDDHIACKANPGTACKRTALGSRDESGSVKFPKLLLNRVQWHGITNWKCLLCKEDIININDHINTTTHMVLIIQSQIIENANCYFREIEENKFFCFGCSDIINKDSFNNHGCKNNMNKKQSQRNRNKKDINKNNQSDIERDLSEILKVVADIRKKYVINNEEKTAKCRICNAFVDVEIIELAKHLLQCHEDIMKYDNIVDHGKHRSELAVYGKKNYIKLNAGGSKGYCSLCDIYISAHMKVAMEHVHGLRHRCHLEIKGLKVSRKHSVPGCRVQTLQHYLKDMFYAKPLEAMCINFSLCINDLSFMLIITLDNNKQPKRKCLCCDMVFDWDSLNEHWKSRQHKNAFVSADVLLLDEEFIRVIHPGVFHCGFCNQVFPYWETMEKHISSVQHSMAKKKNELACTLALQWYTEQETNGAIRFSDDLYLRCLELGILK